MSFISDSDKSQFQSAYKEFFDSFKEDIVVHRRGQVSVVDVNLTQIFGYDEPSSEANYTYEVTNSTFKGLVIYPSTQISELAYVEEIKANLVEGEIIIKVEEDCKNYLTAATVERIDIKNKSYKLASKDSEANKVMTGYYFFKLAEGK